MARDPYDLDVPGQPPRGPRPGPRRPSPREEFEREIRPGPEQRIPARPPAETRPPRGGGETGIEEITPLRVPFNLDREVVQPSAARHGVPAWVLWAILRQENSGLDPDARNDNADGTSDWGLAQINDRHRLADFGGDRARLKRCALDPACAIDYMARSTRREFDGEGPAPRDAAGLQARWLDAGANWHRKVRDALWGDYRARLVNHASLGWVTTSDKMVRVRQARELPEGLSEREFEAAQAVADRVFLDLLGRLPSDDEYAQVVRRGLTPDQLEAHLRAQPHPTRKGVTVGDLADAREIADAWSRRVVGRRADEGEVNWLLQARIPLNDEHVSAFYEQVRDRAVWAADPKRFRERRDSFRDIWKEMGLFGEPDAALVNDAVAAQWSPEQMRDAVAGRPAPGFAQGVTVGEVARLRQITGAIKEHYLPGQPVTQAELQRFATLDPLAIRDYYRSLPVGMRGRRQGRATAPAQAAGFEGAPRSIPAEAAQLRRPAEILTNPEV